MRRQYTLRWAKREATARERRSSTECLRRDGESPEDFPIRNGRINDLVAYPRKFEEGRTTAKQPHWVLKRTRELRSAQRQRGRERDFDSNRAMLSFLEADYNCDNISRDQAYRHLWGPTTH